ncbi:hypothetical protein AB1Y20_013600 [Prymnesium parvum]|uniref:Uncharacterized protein n=1 Tax=Prymnesium parvum TaxID=97485 RepID=A0AB34IHQ5_PRYPA
MAVAATASAGVAKQPAWKETATAEAQLETPLVAWAEQGHEVACSGKQAAEDVVETMEAAADEVETEAVAVVEAEALMMRPSWPCFFQREKDHD